MSDIYRISKINLDFKKFKFEKLSGRLNLVNDKLSKFHLCSVLAVRNLI